MSPSHSSQYTLMSSLVKKAGRTLIPVFMGAALTATLSGCQTAADIPAEQTAAPGFWQSHQGRLMSITSINMLGRVIIDQQGERRAVNFFYRGSGNDSYELRLIAGGGKQLALLKVEPSRAVLDMKGTQHTGRSAEELLLRHLKIKLPVNNFHKVLMGMSLGEDSKVNDFGLVTRSSLGAYTIDYLDYDSYQNIAIPCQLQITGNDITVDVTVRDIRDVQIKYPE